MTRKLLVVDTNALFHRGRNALLRSAGDLTTSWGQPVTGTYGYLNALLSTLEKREFDCVLPVYDAGGNFRKKESEDYKANRGPVSDSFSSDFSLLIDDVLPTLGLNPVGIRGYEADDVIASVCASSPGFGSVSVLTCDRDLLQCVSDRVQVILFNSAKRVVDVDVSGVLDIYGVLPHEVPLLKALAGDPSDNVAGLKGVGGKTAAKIVVETREGDEDLSHADRIALHPKVRERAQDFLGNLRIVTVVKDIDVKWFASSAPETALVDALFERLEFRSFLKEPRRSKILRSLQK